MKTKRSVFLLILLFFIVGGLYAYQLSPLNVTFDPTGAGSARVYTIVNDSDEPIAIEVSAEQRIIDIDGNEVNQDGSAYFSIQPSRMIIRPDSTQLVRVQYRGPQTVTRELSFRIISEQIAMPRGAQDAAQGQMISFLFVYSTSAYVRPTRVVESVTPTVTKTSDGKLEIVLENTGSVHQMLNSLAITLTGDNGAVYTLSEEEVGPLSGQNLLTDSKLRTIIEIPEALSSSENITATISYDYTYSV
ncbi:MAG: molecular chaperone [Spirochaetes bacterium]|uniref:Molecular chaperone n=1 Tax=Candidatus Ornithospirochaeta stercoripullorum TaxID=2840899 RepID=A0A9D9E438_9SPIO|nr:molecular chaperone [Candidatus Ornithospirochaeta stercoripullorum]